MKYLIDIVHGLAQARGCGTAILGFVYGPLGVLSQIRGHEQLSKDLIKVPEVVLHAVQVTNESLVEFATAQVEAGAHGVGTDAYEAMACRSSDM